MAEADFLIQNPPKQRRWLPCFGAAGGGGR